MRAKLFWSTVITLGVIALSFRFQVTRSTREATKALADLATQRRALETQIRRARLDVEAAEFARLSAAGAAAPSGSEKPTSALPAQTASSSPKSERELIASDPKLQLLSLESDRAQAELDLATLSRALAISPAKSKKLQELGLNYLEFQMDLRAVAQSQNAASPVTIAKLREQAHASLKAAQIEVLGEDGYQQLQDYGRTVGLRDGLVHSLAVAASLEGVPITGEQGRKLLQAAREAGVDDPKSNNVSAIISTIDWSVLDHEAQKILTPAQFTLFQRSVAPGRPGAGARIKTTLEAAIRRAKQADAVTGQASSPPSLGKAVGR